VLNRKKAIYGVHSLADVIREVFIDHYNFPHDLWNVHDRVSEALPRTNNSIEAWHHSFQRSLQCWHPNLWKFIDALKKEERMQRLNINQLVLGQVVVPKKTDENVSNIVGNYANRTFTEFLHAIAHNLRF